MINKIKPVLGASMLCCMLSVAPSAHALTTVEILYNLAISIIGTENPAVTDVGLRSVCIHGYKGSYGSVATSASAGLHVCATTDLTKTLKPFMNICENKLGQFTGVLDAAVDGVPTRFAFCSTTELPL